MLVQSWGGEIHILAALPKAWPEGALRGVRAKGGIEIDLDWADGKMKRLRLRGKPHDKVRVRYRDRLIQVVLDKKGAGAVM